jgi:hypothetical protein
MESEIRANLDKAVEIGKVAASLMRTPLRPPSVRRFGGRSGAAG